MVRIIGIYTNENQDGWKRMGIFYISTVSGLCFFTKFRGGIDMIYVMMYNVSRRRVLSGKL